MIYTQTPMEPLGVHRSRLRSGPAMPGLTVDISAKECFMKNNQNYTEATKQRPVLRHRPVDAATYNS